MTIVNSNPSGELKIDDNGKLLLGGEVFDSHGFYPFKAFIDTGSEFGFVIQKDLADAVCAPIIGSAGSISVGAGTSTISGVYRKISFRFGQLVIKNYNAVVLNKITNRNILGLKFFQDCDILLLADFHEGSTKGGLVSTDRKLARAIGNICHCLIQHDLDLSKYLEPCPACGEYGE